MGVGQRESAKTVGKGLRKSRHRDCGYTKLIAGKGAYLAAVHKKELAGKLIFLTVIEIQIRNKLIVTIGARRCKGTLPRGRVLWRWNYKTSVS